MNATATERLCVEIALTIPDNEAETAAATLRRLGVAVERLERADLYVMEADSGTDPAALGDSLRHIETLFNPNKHLLRSRAAAPEAGEVWIHERAHGPEEPEEGAVRVAGRALPGVVSIERFTLWRLRDAAGSPAADETVMRATETLLCNPAFQMATTR